MFKGPVNKDSPPYARLMRTAEVLFGEHGFHATGVNMILQEAGVAKMTLYNNFTSKDELIEAVVRLKSRKVIAWLESELARRQSQDGAGPLEALFGAYGAWFEEDGFRGCFFTRAALEFPDPTHPAHKAAASHTRKLFSVLEGLAENLEDCPVPCPAEHLLLLTEGATAVAAKTGAGKASAERALDAAKTLLSP